MSLDRTPKFGSATTTATGLTPGRSVVVGDDGYIAASLIPWSSAIGISAVQSVAGRTGVIVLGIADVGGLQAALDAKVATADINHYDGRYYTKSEVDTIVAAGGITLPIAISGVTNLQASLDAKSNVGHVHDDIYYRQNAVQALVNTRALTVHTHTLSQITDVPGSNPAAARSVGTASGNVVVVQSNGKVLGSLIPWDTMPTGGTNVVNSINGKTGTIALLAIADTSGLQSALNGKAATVHTHVIADVTGLQAALDGKAPLSHTQSYTTITGLGSAATKDAGTSPNQVLLLDGAGRVPTVVLPPISITDTFVVANQAAMLALTVETGDVAVRTDLNKSFILRGTDPTLLSDWQELLTPPNAVLSVNGLTGVVVLTTTNVSEGSNQYFTGARAISAVSGNANTFTVGPQTIAVTNSSSSGTVIGLQLTPTYTQSGTAGSTNIKINRTETSLGSGSHLFLDFQVATVSKFSVSNTGVVVATGFTGPGTGLTGVALLGSANTFTAGPQTIDIGALVSNTVAFSVRGANNGTPRIAEFRDGQFGAVRASIGQSGEGNFTYVQANGLTATGWQVSDTALALGSANAVLWSSSTAFSGTKDVGLIRGSAGVVKVTNGSTGDGKLVVGGVFLDGNGNGLRVASNATGTYWNVSADQFICQTGVAGIQLNGTANQVNLGSGTVVLWGSGTGYNTTKDVGLARSAAGILKVTDGSTGVGTLSAGGINATTASGFDGNVGFGASSIAGTPSVVYIHPAGTTYANNKEVRFTSNSNAGVATGDVGLTRSAAGVLKVTDGTTSGDGSLTVARLTAAKRIVRGAASLATSTAGSAVTPNCDDYNTLPITANASFTINAPTGTPLQGQQLLYRVKNTSGGTITVTLATGANAHRFGTGTTSPLAAVAAGKTDYIPVTWNAEDSRWDVMSQIPGF
jgi:hypothetical protein